MKFILVPVCHARMRRVNSYAILYLDYVCPILTIYEYSYRVRSAPRVIWFACTKRHTRMKCMKDRHTHAKPANVHVRESE